MALSMCVIKMLWLICVHGCVRVAFLLSLIKISFVKYSSHIVQPTYWKCTFFSKPLSNLKYTQSCTGITSQFYKGFLTWKKTPPTHWWSFVFIPPEGHWTPAGAATLLHLWRRLVCTGKFLSEQKPTATWSVSTSLAYVMLPSMLLDVSVLHFLFCHFSYISTV